MKRLLLLSSILASSIVNPIKTRAQGCPINIVSFSVTPGTPSWIPWLWNVTDSFTNVGAATRSIGIFCSLTRLGCQNVSGPSGTTTFSNVFCTNKNDLWLGTYTGVDCRMRNPCNLVNLPLRLISFTAIVENHSAVNLKCRIVSEGTTAPTELRIERSYDGFSFDTLAKIPTNPSRLDSSYSYIDENPTGNNIVYYRVALISIEGNKTYSNILIVHMDGKTNAIEYCFDGFVLKIPHLPLNTRVRIFDSIGRPLLESTNNKEIFVGNLPSGAYIVHIENSDKTTQVFKIIK